MTSEQFKQIRERAEKATPGLWEADSSRQPDLIEIVNSEVVIAEVWAPDDGVRQVREQEVNDATFIAHARTDIPLLCDELEKAWRERDEARAHLAKAARAIPNIAGPIDWRIHKLRDSLSERIAELEQQLQDERQIKEAEKKILLEEIERRVAAEQQLTEMRQQRDALIAFRDAALRGRGEKES